VLTTIWQRKHRWLGHVLRNEVLLRDIVKERIKGKTYRGKKAHEVKRAAEDRDGWRATDRRKMPINLLNSRILNVFRVPHDRLHVMFYQQMSTEDYNIDQEPMLQQLRRS